MLTRTLELGSLFHDNSPVCTIKTFISSKHWVFKIRVKSGCGLIYLSAQLKRIVFYI